VPQGITSAFISHFPTSHILLARFTSTFGALFGSFLRFLATNSYSFPLYAFFLPPFFSPPHTLLSSSCILTLKSGIRQNNQKMLAHKPEAAPIRKRASANDKRVPTQEPAELAIFFLERR
jgi:hypothetical protein